VNWELVGVVIVYVAVLVTFGLLLYYALR